MHQQFVMCIRCGRMFISCIFIWQIKHRLVCTIRKKITTVKNYIFFCMTSNKDVASWSLALGSAEFESLREYDATIAVAMETYFIPGCIV